MTCKTILNYGRRFCVCGLDKVWVQDVQFFVWLDEKMSEQHKKVITKLVQQIRDIKKRVENS